MNEQIEMYRAVQKYLEKWEYFDRCYHLKHGFGTVVGVEELPTLSIFFDKLGTYEYCDKDDLDLLWLPPPTPRWPGDDNRNLWDMVDWKHFSVFICNDGAVILHQYKDGQKIPVCTGKPLPEALLRAIDGKGE